MKNIKINSLQFGTIIFFFMLTILLGIGINNISFLASRDAFISIIISYIVGFIPLIIFIYLFNQKKNIIELIYDVFGKVVGTIINILLLIPVIVISSITISTICSFLVSQFLSSTPIYVIYFAIFFVIFYGVYNGIEAISRTALILLSIVIFFIFISIVGNIFNINFDNFLPLFEYGIVTDIKAGISFSLTDVIPLFILLSLSLENISDKDNVNKSIVIAYSLGFLISFILVVMTIGTLGIYLTNIYQYPEYMMLKKVTFFNFLNRLENFISIQWLFLTPFVGMMSLLYVNRLFKIKTKKMSGIVSLGTLLVIFLFCILVFKNNTVLVEFSKDVYPHINFWYFMIVLVVSVGVFLKKKKLKL